MAHPKQIDLVILIAAGLVAYFVALLWLVAEISGWRRLAASYANQTPFEAVEWRFAQATVRRWVPLNSNLPLRIGADGQFLYLRTWPFHLPWFQELRVPWPDVSVKEKRSRFWKYCSLRFREQPGVEMQLSEKVARRVLTGAGGSWANGRPEFPA